MFPNPFKSPFAKRRKLFGTYTTPRDFKHGARDIPFGKGAKSLYVDGTDGHDSNDGESWKTPKKTIQEALDMADPWTDIFIKAGIYNESIEISTTHINLLGDGYSTIITGTAATNNAILVTASFTHITSLKMQYLGAIGGLYANDVTDCIFCDILVDRTSGGNRCISLEDTSYSELYNIISTGSYYGIVVGNVCNNLKIHDSVLGPVAGGGGLGIYTPSTARDVKVSNCDITGYFIQGQGFVARHNNILTSCTDNGSSNTLRKNYYDFHTNIDNGHGTATEPFIASGTAGTKDRMPVAVKNGWDI